MVLEENGSMADKMTRKERMLSALDGGKPDRMPCSIHQWQKYHLDKYLGGISDLEAFDRFGMDAQAQYFGEMGQTQDESASLKASSPQWKIDGRSQRKDIGRLKVC